MMSISCNLLYSLLILKCQCVERKITISVTPAQDKEWHDTRYSFPIQGKSKIRRYGFGYNSAERKISIGILYAIID